MCTIEVKGVQITLTKEQLDFIDSQRGEFKDYTQIKSYENACNYLKEKIDSNLHPILKLRIMGKAINRLINSDKFPNWKDSNQKKWYNWLEYCTGSGSWVYYCSGYYAYCCGALVYLKHELAAKHLWEIGKDLYIQIAEEEL